MDRRYFLLVTMAVSLVASPHSCMAYSPISGTPCGANVQAAD
ncbi:hypothetical protein [Methylobacter sp. BBA5.1]|nr:hypothetical protein [Methylobacter sp. BBA5.1]